MTSFEFVAGRVAAAVERVAAVDPNPSDPFRGLYISDEKALSLSREDAAVSVDERLRAAAAALGLDALETAALAVCAAPEFDPRYGRLYAYLQDDVTRKLPSPRLVAALLADDETTVTAVLACFAHDAPLRRQSAIRLSGDDATPLGDRGLRIAERLAAYLVGARLDGDALAGPLRLVPRADADQGGTVDELAATLRQPTTLPVVVAGPDAAALVSAAAKQPLVCVRATDLHQPDVFGEARLVAALEGRRLVVEALDDLEPAERARVERVVAACAARGERLVFVAHGRQAAIALGDRAFVLVDAPMPDFSLRAHAWSRLTGVEDAREVAAKFRLSLGQIAEAAEVARVAASAREGDTPTPDELDLGARRASSSKLGELATHIELGPRWEDLVVPERQREMLRSISSHLRYRDQVLSDWGYERLVSAAQGLKVLFAGESGTGKTMAAQVLARELGLDLFRVDLATVVSKYIGETEKNLDRIFAAAEGSNAILFFDEADALFGKRSEISDAHDRYANIEVAYLLQKMEGYAGAVVLATNFRRNLDDAFARRLDFVIDFPFPEEEDRGSIWRRLLPDKAPLAADVDVDFLAAQFKLSGGAIRNCTLAAAFRAAEEGSEIAMRHLVRAVAQEYGKQGRLTLEADFEHFHELLRPDGALPEQRPDRPAARR